jgi:phenylalanyl-tRNA synthetase beta chain
VKLLNPLSSEYGWLRGSLLPGLVKQVELNWSNHVRDVRLFEVGTTFARPAGSDPATLPEERLRVAGVVTGTREPAHWTGTGKQDVDPWDLKGLFEAAVALAFPAATVQVEDASWTARTPDGRTVGRAVRLEADAPPWAGAVYGFEVEVDPSPRPAPRMRVLPVTPASERDLALLLPGGVTAAEVAAVITSAGGALLERIDVLDEYRGSAVGEGLRSVAFRLTFRAPDRTLAAAEVDAAEGRVLAALERELNVRRRG